MIGDAEHGADAIDRIQLLVRLSTPPDIVNHITNILTRLGLKNRTQAAL